MFVISLYIDDLFFIENDEKIIHGFKNGVIKKYEINDFGLIQYFLCIKINQMEVYVFISQKKYL
jgi:Reverse transcriptase (RNA-dependent DNA polymerase)